MLRSAIRLKSTGSVSPMVLGGTSAIRFRSAQAQSATAATVDGAVDPEWASALPYEKIPRPGMMAMVKGFLPGGRYQNKSPLELHRLFREDYGDILVMLGALGRKDTVMSYNPDDYAKLFRTEGQWPERRALESILYYRKHVRPDVFKGNGGLASEQGESWQRQRTIVNPVMMQPKTIRLYVDKLDTVARDFMEIIRNIRDDKNELPADFDQWLNRWALETIGVLALDTRLGILGNELTIDAAKMIKNVREFFQLTYQLDIEMSIWKYYKTAKFRRLMTVLDEITSFVMEKIDEAVIRLENNASQDSDNQSVLEKLLKIDKNVAVMMAFDMLFAGVDTTSAGSIGILYCLAKHPEKQSRLREELRTILPTRNSPLTPENMRNLPYLRACIKEGLRMYSPVAGNIRAAGRDIVLQGYRIPKGTDVAMASMILYQDDQFFERGMEFLPERWLKDAADHGCPRGRDVHPFLYLPFGFGPRACIGKRMAMLEIELIIARITRQFEFRWNYGDLKITASIVNTPTNELKFQLVEVDD